MSDEFLGADQAPKSEEQSPPASTSKEVKAEAKSDYSEFLDAITNAEGKPKYKTVADALLGAAKAQEHIARIEQENADLRGVAKKVETMEQLLQRLETGKTGDPPAQPKIEDQESQILSVLEKREAANKERANRQSVLDSLRTKFGDKAEAVLKAKADDLGLSLSDLGNLAARSPKAVLGYFNSEVKGTPSVLGTVNTDALVPKPADGAAPANMLWGASHKEQIAYMRQIKESVNRELGLQ